MAKRFDVKVLGRTLGTATGWDGDSGECYWFMDFQPKDGINLKAGELHFDENKGLMGQCDPQTGELIDPVDICSTLLTVPRD